MLDPRDLRIFLYVAEELHFGRAALRLGIAQSTVSAQLRRLEDILGASLFERRTRAAVRLTDAGRIFVDEARGALDAIARAEAVGRMAGRGEAGPLEIAYIFSAAMNGALARVLSWLRTRMPLLEPMPRQLGTPQQIEAVGKRRMAFGLCRPRPRWPADIAWRVVHREPVGLLVPSLHRLATETTVSAFDLSAETFLLPQFNERFGLIESLDRLAILGGFSTPKQIQTNDFIAAANLSEAGFGVVLAPQSLRNFSPSRLLFIPVTDYPEELATVLIWHRSAPGFIPSLSDDLELTLSSVHN